MLFTNFFLILGQGVHERYGLCDNGNNCDSEHFSLMQDNYNSKEGSTPCLPGKRDVSLIKSPTIAH